MPNLLSNPSFETDTNGWTTWSNAPTLTRITTDAWIGSACYSMVATTTGNAAAITSPYTAYSATPGQAFSGGGYVKAGAGTIRSARVDVRFFDSGGIELGGNLGTATAPNTSTWTRLTLENCVAPASTAYVRLRFAYLAAVSGDQLLIDGAQLELGTTLPVYNEGGPAVPTGLTATAISSSRIDVSWDAVGGVSGYDLEENGSVVLVGTTQTSVSRTGLSPNTTYTYRVRSVQ